MNTRASVWFIGISAALSLAPAARAAEGGYVEPTASGTPAIALPAYLETVRLPAFEAAWRHYFSAAAVVAPIAGAAADAEAKTIDAARETLSRAQQVSLKAAAVRDRAEELSRRFAVGDHEDGTAPASEAIAAAAAGEAASPSVPEVSTTGSIETPPPAAVEPQIQQAAVQTEPPQADMAPASMLGGPRVEEDADASPAAGPAPVIEDMAAPVKQATKVVQRRAPPAATYVPAQKTAEVVEVNPRAPKPDTEIMMPTELRAFGWGSQP